MFATACADATQALCSAMAKMCVRELRTEAPNTSVFYMAAVSLVAAVIGCFLPLAWGDTSSFKMPNHWLEWLLLCGVGASLQASVNFDCLELNFPGYLDLGVAAPAPAKGDYESALSRCRVNA